MGGKDNILSLPIILGEDMQWKDRIWEIKREYDVTKNMKVTSLKVGCSIGLVSEAIKLTNHWDIIKECSTRVEALSLIKNEKNYDIILHESLNSVALCPDVNTALRKFDNNTFNLIIIDGEFLKEEDIYSINRVLHDDSYFYIFSQWDSQEAIRILLSKYFRLVRYPLVWVDTYEYHNFKKHYYQITQPIIVARKGYPKLVTESSNVFNYNGVSPTLRIHYKERPIKLIERLINLSLKNKGNVLDCYCHSAEVLLAARNLGHNYFGVCRWEKEWTRICRKLSRNQI